MTDTVESLKNLIVRLNKRIARQNAAIIQLSKENIEWEQWFNNLRRAGTAYKDGTEYDVYVDLSHWTIEEDTKRIIRNIAEGRSSREGSD